MQRFRSLVPIIDSMVGGWVLSAEFIFKGIMWWCHKKGLKGNYTPPVKPFFEFHIHSDHHVSGIKVNKVVFCHKLFQFPVFSDSKKCSHVAPPLRPHWLTLSLLPCPHVRSHWLSPRLSFPGLGRVQGVIATRADLLPKNSWFTSTCT